MHRLFFGRGNYPANLPDNEKRDCPNNFAVCLTMEPERFVRINQTRLYWRERGKPINTHTWFAIIN